MDNDHKPLAIKTNTVNPQRQNKKGLDLNSLYIGISRFNDILKESYWKTLSHKYKETLSMNRISYSEALDEVCCYIQRTF